MKAKGMFVSTLLIIDTFLGSYYLGVHERAVKVIDPTLPPIEIKKEVKTPVPVPASQANPKEEETKQSEAQPKDGGDKKKPEAKHTSNKKKNAAKKRNKKAGKKKGAKTNPQKKLKS